MEEGRLFIVVGDPAEPGKLSAYPATPQNRDKYRNGIDVRAQSPLDAVRKVTNTGHLDCASALESLRVEFADILVGLQATFVKWMALGTSEDARMAHREAAAEVETAFRRFAPEHWGEEATAAGFAAPRPDTIILMREERAYSMTVLSDASVVIDQNGIVTKNRSGMAGMEASAELLEKAVPVFPGIRGRQADEVILDEVRDWEPEKPPEGGFDTEPDDFWTPVDRYALLAAVSLTISIAALAVALTH